MMKYLTSKNSLLILRFLFANPDKQYYMQELARLLGKKAGVLQKAINYLVSERIILDERRGNLRFFSINQKHPLYEELRKIIFKTIGVEGTLREMLSKIKDINFAFLYGSFAKDTSDAISDIDLCIIGKVKMRDINPTITKTEKAFQREINYIIYSVKEFRDKYNKKDPFILDILKGAIFLIGSYEKLIRKP